MHQLALIAGAVLQVQEQPVEAGVPRHLGGDVRADVAERAGQQLAGQHPFAQILHAVVYPRSGRRALPAPAACRAPQRRRLAVKPSNPHDCSGMGKATLYLQDDVHHALRLKAAETHESMSQLVNDALRVALTEDLEDIRDWRQRRNEKSVGYDEFLELLRTDGTI